MEYDWVVILNFKLCNTHVYSIHFFLDYCIFVVVLPRSVVCSWGVQDQHSWCGLSKVVCFLRGSRSLLWCVVFVIWFWLHSGLPSDFWGLDLALGVRVNQYKSVCVILSFPDLTYICFKLFLLTVDKNNWLFRQNNRLIFWKSTKTALCIAFLDSFLCNSSLAFIIPLKFAKISYKQFTPSCLKPYIITGRRIGEEFGHRGGKAKVRFEWIVQFSQD